MNNNFIASSASTSKIYLWKESYRFHRGFDFSRCGAHEFLPLFCWVFKQKTASLFFFFDFASWLICRNSDFLFLRKNRNIVLFVNSLQKRKAQESINKVSAELVITTPSATDGSLPFNQAELYELHLLGDGDLVAIFEPAAPMKRYHPRTASSWRSHPAS